MERAQKKVEARNFDIRKTLIKFDDVMNDQRQVIFSQRLKILKNKDIEEILDDFLNELIDNLETLRNSYQKTNDKKTYLTSIKNTFGNAINDEELISLALLNKDQFSKKNKRYIFIKKAKKSRYYWSLNRIVIWKKKIFLQIIDFSWRSHLQYLEQLRQVIGLRSYGQKGSFI